MSNAAVLVLYVPIVIVTISIMVIAYCRDRKRPLIRSFLFLGVMATGWEVTTMLYTTSWTIRMATFLYDAKIPFVAFSALALFIFALRFYRLDQYVRPQLIILLSIIPLITTLLVITSAWHDLFRTRLDIVTLWPRQGVIYENGIWYWVHAAYSYLLLGFSAIITFTQHLKLPKSNRIPSLLVIGGTCITLFCNLLSITGLIAYPFNLAAISIGVSAILFYLALCSCSQMDFLMLARSEIFHFIDDSVFVLNAAGKILDINRSGEAWLKELGFTRPVERFEDVKRFLQDSGAEFRYAEEHDTGLDVFLTTNHQTSVYNIREKRIASDDGYEIGAFVTCTDVTRNRLLINRLEETAEVDALTGLQNRWSLNRTASRLMEQDLPLTLMMGDVDGLKAINDNYGHQQGDRLLRETARVLKEFCPPPGQAFRVGGDEFVLLLPGCDRQRAEAIAGRIHDRLAGLQTQPFRIGISLGLATETRFPYSLEELMRHADEDMYRQKKQII